jgi:hypothetical protein
MANEKVNIVYVTTWSHRHGSDIAVFKTEKGAELYRQEIALDQWKNEIGDIIPLPSTPVEVANTYFEEMGGRCSRSEYFETNVTRVKP